jgi:hypothetical protein
MSLLRVSSCRTAQAVNDRDAERPRARTRAEPLPANIELFFDWSPALKIM